jgi:hypothetical protein
MTIHLPAVCEIRSGSTLSALPDARFPLAEIANRHATSTLQVRATACEIADEVRSNLFAGLDVWMCGEPDDVSGREPCPRRNAHVNDRNVPTPLWTPANCRCEHHRCNSCNQTYSTINSGRYLRFRYSNYNSCCRIDTTVRCRCNAPAGSTSFSLGLTLKSQ